MSKKLLRQLTLARCVPYRPYKLTARQLQEKLEEEGIQVSLRTVQRDLEEMSGMGLFDLTSDDRSKPHGWCFERNGLNDFANFMPLGLAMALKTWNDQAADLLPASVLTELTPIIDKATQVINDSQSELAGRWMENVVQLPKPFAGSPEMRRATTIRDALWRGRKFTAEIKRQIKGRTVWLRYEQVNPLGIVSRKDGTMLLCTMTDMDPKIYGIPFEHIKDVELTSRPVTQPREFSTNKLVREKGYQEEAETIHFVGRVTNSGRPLLEDTIPGHNPRLTRYDKQSMMVETDVKDSPEFRRWLTDMAGKVEVLAPESLKTAK
ncbi:helix-turn-helix transcriptional regulator [Oceanimonas baumannii]|uniref:DNA-binding transcriptional regulator YafY n=1 Tax=Oceanimonas baumannii TaxID=129578 RepID=A0A235CGH5_9GAMM|nr:WYL domain-containing protein [Oceanimonas baumannii]OYD23640.1 WYL domain-containing protein [Oceanimonas baumannii]TDW55832.1 putative DNA-binding transcriptional regulator YafY [Oceanimonas baumannii]